MRKEMSVFLEAALLGGVYPAYSFAVVYDTHRAGQQGYAFDKKLLRRLIVAGV